MSDEVVTPPAGTPPAADPPAAVTPPVTPPAGDPPAAVTPPADPAITPPSDKPSWGDDWRERLAGNDQDFLKTLKRYTSPETYAKAGYQAQQKIRSGEYKRGLNPEASAEDVAAWRKEVGIPDTPDGYKIEPPKGVVFGETDKPMLSSFAQHAHANNWDQKTLNDAINWYGAHQEQQLAERVAQDDRFALESEDTLRSMWPGEDFHRNRNAYKGLVQQLPKEFQDLFATGRTADGRVMGDHPTIVATFAQLARELNPAASVVPAGVQDAPKAIDTELSQLRTMMRDPSGPYHRGPEAAKNQARYRELLSAQEKMKGRAA
jgi:hypothetical protein